MSHHTRLDEESQSTITGDGARRRGRHDRKSSRGSATPCQANVKYSALAKNSLLRAVARKKQENAREVSAPRIQQ